jgi:hypothetical protein
MRNIGAEIKSRYGAHDSHNRGDNRLNQLDDIVDGIVTSIFEHPEGSQYRYDETADNSGRQCLGAHLRGGPQSFFPETSARRQYWRPY